MRDQRGQRGNEKRRRMCVCVYVCVESLLIPTKHLMKSRAKGKVRVILKASDEVSSSKSF